MNSKPSKKRLRNKLDNELSDIQFNEQMQMAVMDKTRPVSFWNRELRIPWPAVALVICMFIAAPVLGWQWMTSEPSSVLTTEKKVQHTENDPLVVFVGGTYYESQLLEGWSSMK